MVSNTNARGFRAKLSECFDKALRSPLMISRGNDRFVLVEESEFLAQKDEVLSLQKNLLAMLEVRSNKTEIIFNPKDHFSGLFLKLKKKQTTKRSRLGLAKS